MSSENEMKVLNVVVENFKNIEKTEVDFAGRSAVIVGKNGAGKSSFIQAICSPIDSNYIPTKPIKKGEERGSINLTIGGTLYGEQEEYVLGLYFSEKHKKGRITITNTDGEKINGGKQFISDIVGNIGFDIQEFIKLGSTSTGGVSKPGVQQQIEILKGLMPREVLEKMHELDKEYADKYSKRTDVNKDVSYARTKLEGHEYSQEELEQYKTLKDVDPIIEKMSNIEKELESFNKVSSGVESLELEIPQMETKLSALMAEIKESKEKLKKGKEWLKGKTKPSIEGLNAELTEARAHNAKVAEISQLEGNQEQIRGLEKISEDLTTRLGKIKEEKKEIFSSSPLPVDGLTFDEEGIYFKGLPFVEGQHPSSTIIAIGVRIGMAMNPNLRLLIIRDGSLLDEKTLKWVVGLCEKENYQILIEKVADNEDVDIEFIEK